MISRLVDTILGFIIDKLFPEEFTKYKCEFEKKNGFLPKTGPIVIIKSNTMETNTNDSGIYPDWGEGPESADELAMIPQGVKGQ